MAKNASRPVDKFKNIKLLLLDVDGVLTDGSIVYDDQGKEIKVFNVKDGLGIRLLMNTGIQVGIVTGRSSRALKYRCDNLNISHVFEGVKDKAAILDSIIEQTGLQPEQIAFIGDDLPDLPLMRKIGLPIAVSDAHEKVASEADMITEARGGRGAVREVCEHLLKSQGHWKGILEKYQQ